MKIFTPSTTIEYADRNNLLQKSLRDSTLNFSIESEYPIVLNKEGGHFSYCFQQDSVLVAHANLWPRIATNKTTKQRWNIGLIGNVATDEQFRGLGIMSKVLAHLKSIAIDTNLSILILWSDLLEFYQKQGFWSFSEERRYIFTRNKLSTALSHLPIHDVFYTNHEIKRFNEAIFETFTHLRPKTFMTVERHPNEYMELLTIPNLNVFTSSNSVGKISAFAILGKGADMESVVHE